jgi:hypothetical protein
LLKEDRGLDDEEIRGWILELMTYPVHRELNNIRVDKWIGVVGGRLEDDHRHLIVKISHRPTPISPRPGQGSFLFAEDKAHKSYYIHRRCFQGGQKCWVCLKLGDELVIIPKSEGIEAKPSHPAERAALPSSE